MQPEQYLPTLSSWPNSTFTMLSPPFLARLRFLQQSQPPTAKLWRQRETWIDSSLQMTAVASPDTLRTVVHDLCRSGRRARINSTKIIVLGVDDPNHFVFARKPLERKFHGRPVLTEEARLTTWGWHLVGMDCVHVETASWTLGTMWWKWQRIGGMRKRWMWGNPVHSFTHNPQPPSICRLSLHVSNGIAL